MVHFLKSELCVSYQNAHIFAKEWERWQDPFHPEGTSDFGNKYSFSKGNTDNKIGNKDTGEIEEDAETKHTFGKAVDKKTQDNELTLANKGTNLCATDSSTLSDANTKLDNNVNVIKIVQALMLIIDFTTPEWVKNLILSLHPIKNIAKHFELPSNDPASFVMQLKEAKKTNYQKIELEEKNATSKKIRNEFDENLERSTISQSAEVSYDQIIEQKLKPEELVCNKELNSIIQVYEFLLIALADETNTNSRELKHHNELEVADKLAIINCREDYAGYDHYSDFEQAIMGYSKLVDGY